MIRSTFRRFTVKIKTCRWSVITQSHQSLTTDTSMGDEPRTPPSPGAIVDHSTIIGVIRSIIPKLTYDKHKGEAGRIGVVGGCETYTGAPYYAAITSLKVGGDLAHVFCTQGAAPVIKAYSPELIVHPLLDAPNGIDEVSKWLPRMHSLVIGPGLGRDVKHLETVKGIITKAKRMRIPLVLDADGVHLITMEPSIIKGYKPATLTPNVMEFARLYQAVMGEKPPQTDPVAETIELSKALDDVTIARKGHQDIICSGDKVMTCGVEGGPRRCGGQGDLLSGAMGVFMHWSYSASKTTESYILKSQGPNIAAAYAACALTKECNRRAFIQHRRSTTTTDMINYIQEGFEALFETED